MRKRWITVMDSLFSIQFNRIAISWLIVQQSNTVKRPTTWVCANIRYVKTQKLCPSSWFINICPRHPCLCITTQQRPMYNVHLKLTLITKYIKANILQRTRIWTYILLTHICITRRRCVDYTGELQFNITDYCTQHNNTKAKTSALSLNSQRAPHSLAVSFLRKIIYNSMMTMNFI